jgi:hypothetical protein
MLVAEIYRRVTRRWIALRILSRAYAIDALDGFSRLRYPLAYRARFRRAFWQFRDGTVKG